MSATTLCPLETDPHARRPARRGDAGPPGADACATAMHDHTRAARRGGLANLHNHTILLRRGDWIFTTYGVFVGLAFFLGVSVALWHDAAAGRDVAAMGRFYLLGLVPLVVLGARAFSVLLDGRALFRSPLRTLLKPGYMLHGGVFGGAVAIGLYASLGGESPLGVLDSAALALPLGEAIARFGCLVYGCCWGRPTTSRVGIRYTSAHAKVVRCQPGLHGRRLHPAQMYASLAHTALFALLLVLAPRAPFEGLVAVGYLVAHPVIRVVLERFRTDDRGSLVGPLTHTNLYSAVQLVAGAALAVVLVPRGSAVALDAGAHLGDVWSSVGALLSVAGISVMVALVFGVHYRQVGQWVPEGAVPGPLPATVPAPAGRHVKNPLFTVH